MLLAIEVMLLAIEVMLLHGLPRSSDDTPLLPQARHQAPRHDNRKVGTTHGEPDRCLHPIRHRHHIATLLRALRRGTQHGDRPAQPRTGHPAPPRHDEERDECQRHPDALHARLCRNGLRPGGEFPKVLGVTGTEKGTAKRLSTCEAQGL